MSHPFRWTLTVNPVEREAMPGGKMEEVSPKSSHRLGRWEWEVDESWADVLLLDRQRGRWIFA